MLHEREPFRASLLRQESRSGSSTRVHLTSARRLNYDLQVVPPAHRHRAVFHSQMTSPNKRRFTQPLTPDAYDDGTLDGYDGTSCRDSLEKLRCGPCCRCFGSSACGWHSRYRSYRPRTAHRGNTTGETRQDVYAWRANVIGCSSTDGLRCGAQSARRLEGQAPGVYQTSRPQSQSKYCRSRRRLSTRSL